MREPGLVLAHRIARRLFVGEFGDRIRVRELGMKLGGGNSRPSRSERDAAADVLQRCAWIRRELWSNGAGRPSLEVVVNPLLRSLNDPPGAVVVGSSLHDAARLDRGYPEHGTSNGCLQAAQLQQRRSEKQEHNVATPHSSGSANISWGRYSLQGANLDNENPVVLVHASDFHIKEDDDDVLATSHDIRNLFVFDAQQQIARIGRPNAVILSGDTAYQGAEAEYNVAREMLGQILDRLGIEHQQVFLVPGNHDVARKHTIRLAPRMLRDQLRSQADRAAETLLRKNRVDLLTPLTAFQEFAAAYGCLISENGYWESGPDTSPPSSDWAPGSFPIAMRGISTVHVSDRNDDQRKHDSEMNDDGSLMYVVRGQLACDPVTEATPFRILIGHHPDSWWRFSDNRRDLMRARYHLHLFGHEHRFAPQATEYSVSLKAGAINPKEAESALPRYNWISITRADEGYTVRIWSRTYDANRQEFREDPEWPGGQGFLVAHNLDAPPTPVSAPDPDQPLDAPAETVSGGEGVDGVAGPTEPAAPPTPSARDVRFKLLSQDHADYVRVFDRLGYKPDADQRLVLGGLEYYDSALRELLRPERLATLLQAMEEEGIIVD